jgi:hypothetical protein
MTTFLAAATGNADFIRDLFARMDILNRPEELLEALMEMPLILASVIVVVGLLCTLNGYRWHKWVVVLLAFFAGLGLGHILSGYVGKSAIVAVALGALFAIIATPMLKITVAVFGGITGAFIGANIWSALNGAQADSNWAGAMLGFVIIAMASIMLFRLVIVLFTSIGGAAMVVLGAITILMHVPGWEPAVREGLTGHPAILPLLLAVAAVGGFVIQESRVRTEKTKSPQGDKAH